MAGLTIHELHRPSAFTLLLRFCGHRFCVASIVAEGTVRPIRVLHVVSAGGISPATQLSLFMPLLTRMPKHRVKAQVVSLAPGFTAGPVLRQNGVPVHDIAFSRKRFTWGAFGELLRAGGPERGVDGVHISIVAIFELIK